MTIAGVDYLQVPATLRFLPPEVDAEERPVVKVGADDVAGSFEEEGGGGAHGRGKENPQVAAGEESERNFALDVLEELDFVEGVAASVHVHEEI